MNNLYEFMSNNPILTFFLAVGICQVLIFCFLFIAESYY